MQYKQQIKKHVDLKIKITLLYQKHQ